MSEEALRRHRAAIVFNWLQHYNYADVPYIWTVFDLLEVARGFL